MNRYFGPKWPDHLEDAMVPTPVGAVCVYCEESFAEGDSGVIYVPGRPEMAHWECSIRQMIGSADCQTRGEHVRGSCIDVRAGQTKRQAALEAVEVFYARNMPKPKLELVVDCMGCEVCSPD